MPVTRVKLTTPLGDNKLGITLNTQATPAPTIYNIDAKGAFATETSLPAEGVDTYYVAAVYTADGKTELPLAGLQTHLTTVRPLELLLTTTADEVAGAKGVVQYSAAKLKGFWSGITEMLFY